MLPRPVYRSRIELPPDHPSLWSSAPWGSSLKRDPAITRVGFGSTTSSDSLSISTRHKLQVCAIAPDAQFESEMWGGMRDSCLNTSQEVGFRLPLKYTPKAWSVCRD